MKTLTVQKELLGTPIVLDIVLEDGQETIGARAAARAFRECERIQNAYSRFKDENELARLNMHLKEWVTVSKEFFELIRFAKRVGEKTEGAFDLSVKSILEGWGYDRAYSLRENVPGHTGAVELSEDRRVRISAPIELGGLGKGYAIDRMVGVLSDFNHVHLNAGGDVFVRGTDEKGNPWKLVFEHPTEVGKGIGFVKSTHLALACSSPSRRTWRNRHHLVDPKAREPARDMLAVYTQSESALIADSYSTALFVLGFEKAKRMLPGLPVEAMLVSPEGKVWMSPGFQGDLFA